MIDLLMNSTNLYFIYGKSVFNPSIIVFVKNVLETMALIFLESFEFLSWEPKKIESIRLRSWICKMCSLLQVAKCKARKMSWMFS